MRRTLADAKASRIPAAIGACGNDSNPRFVTLLNEAQERLLKSGLWWGTVQRWRFCATDGCIALPSQIATLLAVAVCGRPVAVRDQFYEFLDNGFGIRQTPLYGSNLSCGGNGYMGGGCMNEAIYRGNSCVFWDINPTGNAKKVQLVCDLADDATKPVLVLGYDQNGNWIRTLQNGAWADGELVALAQSPGTASVNKFSSVTDVQPPTLNGQWWMYELDSVTAAQRLLSQYQYYDTRPSFARYLFPGIRTSTQTTGACTQTLVEALVKLEFVPALKDSDYLVIGNLPALKEMMMALSDAENEANNINANSIVAAGESLARRLLDQELDHYLGAGRRTGITLAGSSIGDNVPVDTFL